MGTSSCRRIWVAVSTAAPSQPTRARILVHSRPRAPFNGSSNVCHRRVVRSVARVPLPAFPMSTPATTAPSRTRTLLGLRSAWTMSGASAGRGTYVPRPAEAPDMVHADLNPSNVLVRDGAVVAGVDIGNAGSGTRATDLTTLLWHTFEDPLNGARGRLWTRILALVVWEGAAVLTATQILLQLEVPIRRGRHEVVPGVARRGQRALDELIALR